jgi:glycosyltransferase involved in cell wall biosynthesis
MSKTTMSGVLEKGVCFYGPKVGGVFLGEVPGGAQLQTALLARALSDRGIRAVIVDPFAEKSRSIEPLLEVVAIPEWRRGIRGLRFLTHRIPGVLRAMRRSGAAVFYARGFSFLYLLPLAAAWMTGGWFVLAAASDLDLLGFRERCTVNYRSRRNPWEWISTIIPNELFQPILLRRADILLVQHELQAAQAPRRKGPVIICGNIVADDVFLVKKRRKRPVAILVGTLSTHKGLDVMREVVDALPDVQFEFVGRVTDAEGRRIHAELNRRPNVALLGPLPRRETLERIASSKVLINTSPYEGFPNTFLEAWAIGTPVISLHIDPGGVIQKHGLGYVCDGDRQRMIALLSQDSYDVDQRVVQRYLHQRHTKEATSSVFLDLLSRFEKSLNTGPQPIVNCQSVDD